MNREILRLAIPNIISNVSIPLLSTVDTALMGRLSELHLGAVGLGAMVFNILYWNFGFLRMGTTGMTAQAYGKNDESEIIHVFGRALLVAFALAFVIILLQVPLAEASIYLMNVSDEQYDLVIRYFYIRIWAAPASLALYGFLGWYFGMQNAIYPLIITLVINVVNIVASFLLVRHYGMDVDGVAWGTVLAQYVGLLLATGLFIYKYHYLLSAFRQTILLQWKAFGQFLTINRDIFIRTVCLSFAFGFFYSQSAKLDEMTLAVNVILLQFLNWMSYGVDGFAYASESLVGKYKGANQPTQLRKAIHYSFYWGVGLAVAYSLIYWPFGKSLLGIFTNQQDVIQASMPFLFWMVIFPPLSTPCYIWDGVFIGLTASKAMRNSMLIAVSIYLLSFYGLQSYGNHGMWAALLLFMIARGFVQWWMYYFGKGGMG